MLNAALYPKGDAIAAERAVAGRRPSRPRRRPTITPAAEPAAKAKLADPGTRVGRSSAAPIATAMSASQVKRADAAKLKAAVKAAKLSKSIKRKRQLHDDQDHA